MTQFDKTALYGHWNHAHEEDGPDTMVLRPKAHALGPSRGRQGFVFHTDGKLSALGSGANDRSTSSEGTWSLAGDRLRLEWPESGKAAEYTLVGADSDRLTLRK